MPGGTCVYTCKLGNDDLSYPVSRVIHIRIGRIGAPFLSQAFKLISDLLLCREEQRSYDIPALHFTYRTHACKPADSASSHHMKNDRLRLVLEMMRKSYHVSRLCILKKSFIPKLPGSLF